MATVWATLGKIWASFYSNVWSHCLHLLVFYVKNKQFFVSFFVIWMWLPGQIWGTKALNLDRIYLSYNVQCSEGTRQVDFFLVLKLLTIVPTNSTHLAVKNEEKSCTELAPENVQECFVFKDISAGLSFNKRNVGMKK